MSEAYLICMKKRLSLAHCLAIDNSLDILCLIEILLKGDIPNENFILNEYKMHRTDIMINHKSKHGCVLVTVIQLSHEREILKWRMSMVQSKLIQRRYWLLWAVMKSLKTFNTDGLKTQ